MSTVSTPLRVLIAPDKFKGTLTAAAAAAALAHGWRQERPQDQIRTLPLTDGGDGFGDCLRDLLKARPRCVQTVDAAHQPCRTPWWMAASHRTAILETAQCIGLAKLPPGRYHPFDLDTLGLAKVLPVIARTGVKTCLIGIGGSATNDGGFGLARGLGWTFWSRSNRPIEHWTDLGELRAIAPPARPDLLGHTQWIVATDVANPLVGPRGASRIYGPQKGLRPTDIPLAERCLRRLSAVAQSTSGLAIAPAAGSGAAGGLGFGLATFVGARLQSGFDLYAKHARLDNHLSWADLVLTGEGALDASTLMGKGVGELARRCASRRIACLGVAGRVRHRTALNRHFARVRALAPDLVPVEEALRDPVRWLKCLAADLARSWPAAG